MKKTFSVRTADLRRALSAVEHVIPRITQLPICSSLLLECAGRTMRITGTDIQGWLTASVDLDTEVHAAMLVNAAVLKGAVAGANVDEISVTFETRPARLVLKFGGSTFRLKETGETNDFPGPAAVPADIAELSLPGKTLARALARVSYAASRGDVRKILESVAFEGAGTTLALVATNGHQLAKTEIALDRPLEKPFKAALPRGMLGALLRLCEEETVRLRFDQKIYVSAGAFEAQLPTNQGTYPQWDRVIPAHHPHSVKINRQALAAAVRRALSTFGTAKKPKGIELHFDGNAGQLRIRCEAEENTIDDELALVVESENELNLRTAVSPVYVADALDVIESENVRMVLNDANTSFGLYDEKDPSWVSVIMPVRM